MASVVVVGGGVIGCAIAYRLTVEGHRVTLLERDRVGAHASGAAAGLLAPYSETWPSTLLGASAAESLALFPELVRRLVEEAGIDVEFRETESVRVALGNDEETRLHDVLEAAHARDGRLEWLAGTALRGLEAELSDSVTAALRAEEAQVTPIRFVEALARATTRLGSEVRQSTPATRLLVAGDRVEGVQWPSGHTAADWVVVAAGPWSPEVMATADVELAVLPRRGQLVALLPDRPLISRMVTHDSYYLVPKPDGSIVAGSTEEERGFDARPTAAGVQSLLAQAQELVPALRDATVNRVWAGIRPLTPNHLPYVGLSDRYANLVVASGHHRDGILLAPVTAERVARGLEGNWQPLG